MRRAVRSKRCLVVLLLGFIGLAGWLALPGHLRSWLEPTAHAAAMTFVVNSAADPGDGTCNASNCTLREAISAANNNSGLDSINFNIAGAGVKTINLTSALPIITSPVLIFGFTQPGYAGTPLIELNGTGAGAGQHGLQLASGGSFVIALTINRFGGDGVRITGAGGNVVLDNYIGTNNAGSLAQGNAGAGVRVTDSPNNTVGGGFCASFLGCSESQLKYGVISGNVANGVVIEGVGATGNVVQRSYIGTNATGTAAVGNADAGVFVNNSPNNTIGGTTGTSPGACTGPCNVISGNVGGNSGVGVRITGTASGNRVVGNFIGTDVNGTSALPNSRGGLTVSAPGTIIGGTTAAERNVISGNNIVNVGVPAGATGVQIQGNFIGTNKDGTASLGSISFGIFVLAPITIGGTTGTTPGGPCTGACNLISGNSTGILILASGVQVQGNYIGTDVTGNLDVGNFDGVFIENGSNVVIGGTTPAARNVISGNALNGVKITDDGSGGGGDDNLVLGNYIGTRANGTQALRNFGAGVFIGRNVRRTIIGGTSPGAGNVISGNAIGVSVDGTQPVSGLNPPSENRIEGNLIGTDTVGLAALPNTEVGVRIFEAPSNTIGGTSLAARNVISGNVDGIQINDPGSQGNQVQGNLIGTDVNGTVALPNLLNGVVIFNAPNNTVGGTTSSARNVVSGNENGIDIQGLNAIGNQVRGNYIGTSASGTSAVPNLSDGVVIHNRAANNTIGGTASGARNLISGNGENGVRIFDSNATGNRVQGNFIGTKPNGTEALPNGSNGVRIDDASANTVGGTTPTPGAAPGNLISSNLSNGVHIFGATATLNVVQGNLLGTDIAGAADLGNSDNGVLIEQGKQNTVGGTAPGARNIISANNANGVEFAAAAAENVVQGNLIGTNAAGTAAVANSLEGVRLTAPKNIIGGTTPATRNVISGNSRDGIRISGAAATENQIQGNFLGTRADGVGQLGNADHGVHINSNAGKNTIGGTAAGAGNTVAFNGGDGVFIQPGNAATKDNAVLSNAIFSNTGLGIDLFPDGVTANDAGDSDTGANNLQNFPALTSAVAFLTSTTVAGTLNSTANAAFRLEFFSNTSCDTSGSGEGQTFVGSINVTTDAGGNVSFTASALTTVLAGRLITATATDPTGNTSEFSQCMQTRAASSDLSINMFDSPDPVAVGSTLTYTITLTNAGPDRGESVVVTDNLPAQANFISCSSTAGGVCGGAGSNRTVTFSTLAAGEMVSVTLITGVNSPVSGGTMSNTATVSAATSDSNATNNSVTITTTVPTTPTPTPTPTPSTLQFSAALYSVVEDCTSISITITRSGPLTGAATVDYATADATASERSDYTTALGTLRFAAGETSKTFDLLINEDSFVEGTETATVMLSNPAGGILGTAATATLEILDDPTEPSTNPADDPATFVCHQYHDFLNRQPDAAGLAFWTNQITQCGTDTQCLELKRINVSAAFFLSIEFQETGYLVYRFQQTAFGTGPLLSMRDFLSDTQEIGRGVVVGATGWEQLLEANKQAYANSFAARSQFMAQYPASLIAAQFVDALNANTLDPQNPGTGGSLSQTERDQLVADLASGAKTRAQVVRAVAEHPDFRAREFNRAFVYMQYVGYLRRNADAPPDNNLDGYNFWLGKLNQFNGNFVQAEMVKAFLVSSEYRRRFAN